MEWISVEDSLPEKSGRFLAKPRHGELFFVVRNAETTSNGWKYTWSDVNICCWRCDEITHWMPLPAPPEVK